MDEIIIQQGDPVQPAHLRNLGARKARGDVLVFLDDDTRLDPGNLSWLRERPRDEVWWAPEDWVDETGDGMTLIGLSLVNLAQFSLPQLATMGGCIMIRRWLFEEAGRFDPHNVAEDMDLGARLKSMGIPKTAAPFTAHMLRKVPSLGKTLERYPEWRKFAEPEETPFLTLRPKR